MVGGLWKSLGAREIDDASRSSLYFGARSAWSARLCREGFCKSLVGLAFCLHFCSAGWSAVADADLLFYCSFDTKGVTADVAKGEAEPRLSSGPVRFAAGIKGQAVVAGEEGVLLNYSSANNILPRQGTIAMWVKPLDWSLDTGNYHAFFITQSAAGWLQLYTIPEDGSIHMLAGLGGGDYRVTYWTAGKLLSNKVLAEGKWLHVVGTWDAANVRIYVNGEFLSSDPYGRVDGSSGNGAPQRLGETFSLGDSGWSRPRTAARQTLVDEVRIYGRPLAPAEVKELYLNLAPPQAADQAHRLTVVKSARPPLIDGVLGKRDWEEPEWQRAAAFTGFIDTRTRTVAERQVTAWFTYDDEGLYFAYANDILPGAPPVANVRQRDGQLWGDDALEFFISPPGETGKGKPVYFHLIGNSASVFYDGKQWDASWNGAWTYQAKVSGQQWIAEGHIRWQDLGLDPPQDGAEWRVNFCRDWQNPQAWTVWGHADDFHDVSGFARLTFHDRGTVARVETLGSFSSGDIHVDVGLVNSGGAAADEVEGTLTAGESSFVTRALVPPNGEAKLEFRGRITDRKADSLALTIVSKTSDQTLWQGSFPFAWTDQVVVKLSPLPSKGLIEVDLDLAGLVDFPRAAAASITLLRSGTAEKVAEFESPAFDARRRASAKLPVAQIPLGSYDVVVDVLEGPTVVATARTRLERRDEPWLGNTIGKTDLVTPPWTPLERAGTTLKCWGREVSFSDTVLPATLVTRQADLLASPIQLEAVVDGTPLTWTGASLEIRKEGPARIDFRTAARSASLRIENDAYLEEDGLLFFTIRLLPLGASVKLDRLTLRIPLRGEHALFFDRPDLPVYRQPLQERAGRLPEGQGSIWRSPFNEYLWLGDYDRGLAWFTEDASAWNTSDATRVLELVRTGTTVELRVHIADAPLSIADPYVVTFGLHPTPVKPLPQGWRLWNLSSKLPPGPNVVHSFPHTTKYFGYPEAPDPAFIRYYVDQQHQRGGTVIPYMHPVRIGSDSAEWQYYGRDWAMPGVDGGTSPDIFGGAHMGLCPGAPAFRDWMAWKNQLFLESTGYDGLYYDHSTPFPCSHAGHEHKPGTVPILAYREHYRRLYTLAKQRNPRNVIAAHVSFGMVMPMQSFSDIAIPGEEISYLMDTAKTDDLLDVIDLDYYLAWCIGRQYGLVPVYLVPAACKGRHHSGYQLLTDSVGTWRSDAPLIQVYQDLGMGADDVEFLPFWSNDKIVQAHYTEAPAGIPGEKYPRPLVSAYRRAGRFVLFAVVNLTRTSRTVGLHVDAQGLGLKLAEYALTDAYTRTPLCAAQETFEVEVEARSYRLVLLQKLNPGQTTEDAVSPLPGATHSPAADCFSGSVVAGSGVEPGTSAEPLLLVGDSGDAAPGASRQSHLAQSFALRRPTQIESVQITGKGIGWIDAGNIYCGVSGLPHPFDLRLYKANADGTPTDELADANTFAWMGDPLPLILYTHRFYFAHSFVLPAGRYALVLSHPPQPVLPTRRINLGVPVGDPSRLPGEAAFVRDGASAAWQNAPGVIPFAVYGYER
jgi:hypothetical protein